MDTSPKNTSSLKNTSQETKPTTAHTGDAPLAVRLVAPPEDDAAKNATLPVQRNLSDELAEVSTHDSAPPPVENYDELQNNDTITILPARLPQRILAALSMIPGSTLLPISMAIATAMITNAFDPSAEQALSPGEKAGVAVGVWTPFLLTTAWIQFNYVYRRANGQADRDIEAVAGENKYWLGVVIAFTASIAQAADGALAGIALTDILYKQIVAACILGFFKWLSFMLSDTPAAWIKLMEAKAAVNHPIKPIANHGHLSFIYNGIFGNLLHNLYAPAIGAVHTLALAEVIIKYLNLNNITDTLKYSIYAASALATFMGSTKFAENFDMKKAVQNMEAHKINIKELGIFKAAKLLQQYAIRVTTCLAYPLYAIAAVLNAIGSLLYGQALNYLLCKNLAAITWVASAMNCIGLMSLSKKAFDTFVMSTDSNEGLLAKFILGAERAANAAENHQWLLIGLSTGLAIAYGIGQTYVKSKTVYTQTINELEQANMRAYTSPFRAANGATALNTDLDEPLIAGSRSSDDTAERCCCPLWWGNITPREVRRQSFGADSTGL